MRIAHFLTPVLLASTIAAFAAEIPDRPEKLSFPPLAYEPPSPAACRVALQSGPVAYVVPDRELPLVNISILVRTGKYLEPAGKQGLANLTGYLLARGGTKSKTAEQLEERLAFLAAHLESGVGDTEGRVGLNLLAKDVDEGLAILREVLTAPRFQDDKIALRKAQMLQDMKQRNDESATIEGREAQRLAFGKDFFVTKLDTAASVEAITRADLEGFHRRWFAPQNFVLAVSGDFDRDAMIKKLEQTFANWPFPGEKPGPVPDAPTFAKHGVYIVNKDVNQSRLELMLPGIMRENPDMIAVAVMNDLLGGGGFTSRLMNRVRSDEGLAYGVSSRFQGGVYYPTPFQAALQTKSGTTAYAASIVLEEMKSLATAPVTDTELNTTKRGIIDTFPRRFASKAQVAGTFATDEFTGRYAKQPDYWQTFRAKVGAVTKDDVQRVAAKYLTPDRVVILVVGDKKEVLKGHPDHAMTLQSLGGEIVDLPLLDPLTLQPLAK